jgi:hypothetical protein
MKEIIDLAEAWVGQNVNPEYLWQVISSSGYGIPFL